VQELVLCHICLLSESFNIYYSLFFFSETYGILHSWIMSWLVLEFKIRLWLD